jgi:signal peptidase II
MLRDIEMTSCKKIFSSGLVMLWVSLLVLLLDRYSKTWVMQHLGLHEPMTIFPFFDLTLAFNTGAAFSFLDSASGWQQWVLGGLALVVSGIVIVWLSKLSSRDYWAATGLCLILGGALGNLWDRILYGYVVDLLSFHVGGWYFAIFNVADSAICVGAFMVFCYWMKKGK